MLGIRVPESEELLPSSPVTIVPADAATRRDVRMMKGMRCGWTDVTRQGEGRERGKDGMEMGATDDALVWTINLMGIYVLPSAFLSRSGDATSV